ncbi:hypothetical protein [Azospirillum doebereinerae]|uniref:Uncharacterized protein n=1 Tax=Azospirillum doebereinerae TaxID=92933 RepID=A0A3S1CG59_9PROT|nr:hypothetical protein [Azospirillum doebereinerae]RUQ68929.1 hypothetical protein EJ913_17305 [Azospirillum doebereinerae]
MLADEGNTTAHLGTLTDDLLLPKEWISSLIAFIAGALPAWRDDPRRAEETAENQLTKQLCGRLNSLCRHTPGWNFLQFRREEPDESDGRRAIDLVASPAGTIIWISGRSYDDFQYLLPIECKRLPTPEGKDRDPREYVITGSSSTGGIQRFKAGHHGDQHERAAMIGYVQANDVTHWHKTVGTWIDDLATNSVTGWSVADKLTLASHDKTTRVATLASTHDRTKGITSNIQIDHLWVEMCSTRDQST